MSSLLKTSEKAVGASSASGLVAGSPPLRSTPLTKSIEEEGRHDMREDGVPQPRHADSKIAKQHDIIIVTSKGKESIEMITICIVKKSGHKWRETDSQVLEFPKSELRKRVYDLQLDLLSETEGSEYSIPFEQLVSEFELLSANDDATESDFDKWTDKLWDYSGALSTEQLMDWFWDLNDPSSLAEWTERIEGHNAFINIMEPNDAVLRNPLDTDSTFHIRIYDYFIDFHEDREMVDDLEFTPADVEADDWTEDIERCLAEQGWRLDSKVTVEEDDENLLVFDCVRQ